MSNPINILNKIFNVIRNPQSFYYHKLAPKLRHRKYPACHPSAVILSPIKFNPEDIFLGQNVFVFKNARISCVKEYAGKKFTPKLSIGENTSIQQNIHITCAGRIKIGKWCAITHNVTITDIDHTFEYPPSHSTPQSQNHIKVTHVEIGDNCMIFPNAVILGSTELGERCVVAANAVVRGKFPPYSLIGGIPAKVIKRYNPQSKKWERTNPDGSFIHNS